MKTSNPLITEYPLMEGAFLYGTSLGNILIGAPPEILKVLLIQHRPMPETIVIPGTLYKFSSSQACLEFPFYHFLFVQQGLARGKKFKVLAKKHICEKLKDMLRITLLGPGEEEALGAEKRLNLPEKTDKNRLKQIIRENNHLALKNKENKTLELEDMVEFIPFEVGDKQVVHEAYNGHAEVSIERRGEDEFTVKCDVEFNCNIRITKPQAPVYTIKGIKITNAERESPKLFSVRSLGASEGFDPTQPANGFLLRYNKKWILWDCPVYLRQHLNMIGLEFDEIDAIVISHVHEDHLDILESIQEGKKVTVYTTPEIFHCMLLKLVAVLDCTYEQAQTYYDFHPLYTNQEFDLFGAKAEVFYSAHVIPALGLRLTVPAKDKDSKLFISGDTLSKRMLKQLSDANIFSDERKKEVENFLPNSSEYNLIFHDSGAGIIHGDHEDLVSNPNTVLYMHTGKEIKDIPENHKQLKLGQRFLIHH